MVGKVGPLARFYDFLLLRYRGDIHTPTSYVVVQPISEFNRPATAEHGEGPVPSRIDEVETLFSRRRQSLPQVRKYLPAAPRRHGRLMWRRAGLQINETVMLVSAIGDQTWERSALCTYGSARKAAAEASSRGWCPASTVSRRCRSDG